MTGQDDLSMPAPTPEETATTIVRKHLPDSGGGYCKRLKADIAAAILAAELQGRTAAMLEARVEIDALLDTDKMLLEDIGRFIGERDEARADVDRLRAEAEATWMDTTANKVDRDLYEFALGKVAAAEATVAWLEASWTAEAESTRLWRNRCESAAERCESIGCNMLRLEAALRQCKTALASSKQLASDGAGEWASRSSRQRDDAQVYLRRIDSTHAAIAAALAAINAALEKP